MLIEREGNRLIQVSRAEGKLADAVREFSYDFRDKVVLDIGSSSGGFTEFALLAGAKRVIAIEKGTNQMKAPLRFHPKVELYEKTDIFDKNKLNLNFSKREDKVLEKEKDQKLNLGFSKISAIHFDVVLADVSFVSLRKILLHVKDNLADFDTDLLVMLKPQFEARPDELRRGIIKNNKIRREIIKNFEDWLKIQGFMVIKKRDNEIAGKNGNLERFYLLKLAKRY